MFQNPLDYLPPTFLPIHQILESFINHYGSSLEESFGSLKSNSSS